MNRYWDSVCFLGWLMAEPNKVDACQGVVQAAQAGEIKIVTSALTLTEVIKLKNHPLLKEEDENKIDLFFQNDFIVIRNVDRFVAEYARRLIWAYPHLKPKDSIHAATAIMSGADVLDTFDGDLLRLDGQIGNPGLRITIPDMQYQTTIEDIEVTTTDESDE